MILQIIIFITILKFEYISYHDIRNTSDSTVGHELANRDISFKIRLLLTNLLVPSRIQS